MTKYPVVSLHHAKGCELELVLTKSTKKLKQCTYDSPSVVPSGRLLSKAKFATPGLPSRPSSVPPATRGHSRDTQPAPRSPRAGLCQTNPAPPAKPRARGPPRLEVQMCTELRTWPSRDPVAFPGDARAPLPAIFLGDARAAFPAARTAELPRLLRALREPALIGQDLVTCAPLANR